MLLTDHQLSAPAKLTTRAGGRAFDQLRAITIETHVNKYAEGSCIVHFGDTKVLCTASVETRVPPFLRNSGQGWVTAEYGMLPRATDKRTEREAAKRAQSGRTQEIQRLIGRSLRACVDLKALGEIQIKIDCDVLQADGGTRCAAITGGYVALHLALQHLLRIKAISVLPLHYPLAAVSCGIYQDTPLLDLDYSEDSQCQCDANFVMTAQNGIIEIQASAEETAFAPEQFSQLYALAQKGIAELVLIQQQAIEKALSR